MRKSAALYAIHRAARGWEVHLMRQKKSYRRLFSDAKYGNQEAALAAAQAWRDEIIQMMVPQPRVQRVQRRRSNSSGPIPGVTAEYDSAGEIKLWRAKTYVDEGRVLQKTFSIHRYGATAQSLAIAERMRQLTEVTGLSAVHPEEPRLRAAPPRTEDGPEPLRTDRLIRQTNRSGVTGVVFRAAGGGWWTAQTTIGGQWVSQSFSVKQLGDTEAFARAVAARREQVKNALAARADKAARDRTAARAGATTAAR